MLQLKDIRKAYTTGDFTQVALDGVSINFRDNEFAAILGPSGSGKTTLLNIIGGLDKYDSGDLSVDGISTKEYKDRDWDTYRNNRIGFVFQSYNLIPHQTVLANVELALTLSGVDREERKKRAIAELKRVGLGDHINKKPSQLSGGQMQRVAIARALINNPEILLADEPTGALDSKTSVQIMDLLTEIAKDRLVIMVTHNPELADEYATRIVNLADGHIIADSDPFSPTTDEIRESKKSIRRASMSFLTALSLSFNNLMSKKGRTIMTAFAGSIGIIGISAILALANGVNNYIASVEEETLSSYPLQINSTSFDMTSMMLGMGATNDDDGQEDAVEVGVVKEMPVANKMLESVGSNDLSSLKTYLESGESDIWDYARDIEYIYNVTPQIFLADTADGVDQINPDNTLNALGMGSAGYSGVMSSMMSTDMFEEMMGTMDMAKESYDLKAGSWPEKYNECMLVLSKHGMVPDYMLYVIGLRDHDKLEAMVKAFINEEEMPVDNDEFTFTYDDFLNLKMKLVCSADFYQYDEEFGVWVDKSDDDEYMRSVVDGAENLVISGIIQPKEDTNSTFMSSGIFYTPELTKHLIEEAGQTDIVKQQLADTSIDVFNGKSFAEEDEEGSDFDMSNLFTIDEGALSAAFQFDQSKMNLDLSGMDIDFDSSTLPEVPAMDPSAIQIDPSVMQPNEDALRQSMARVLGGFFLSKYYDPTDQAGLPQQIADYMSDPTTQALISQGMADAFDTSAMTTAIATQVQAAVTASMSEYMQQVMGSIQTQVKTSVTKAMGDLASNMSSAMNIDTDAFMNAFSFDMDEDELTELIMSMMSPEVASLDNNLAKLDYAYLDKPYEIDIFSKDFEAKEGVTKVLDEYNQKMKDEGEESKEITYTDIVGALMSSVTTIIDMISYVLIAFVSISLIVSSIMIGVITYISVLERKKEIGILRAIGASKRNISQVFNAETIIEGLIAGVLGVGITAIACIPANAIVYSLFDVPNVAILPWQAAIVLILISVFLTFIAGLIPASSASRKDPVEALRSE